MLFLYYFPYVFVLLSYCFSLICSLLLSLFSPIVSLGFAYYCDIVSSISQEYALFFQYYFPSISLLFSIIFSLLFPRYFRNFPYYVPYHCPMILPGISLFILTIVRTKGTGSRVANAQLKAACCALLDGSGARRREQRAHGLGWQRHRWKPHAGHSMAHLFAPG